MNNGSKQSAGIKEIGIAGPGFVEDERSESERNKETVIQEAEKDYSKVPDPQVLEHPERRRFSVDYKARIVREADACTRQGQISALLRREGLYSSQLAAWRKAYRNGALAGLRDDKRGRKQIRHPLETENNILKKNNARLERRLKQAEAVIDIQKKLSEILGVPLTGIESEEDD